MTDYNRIINHPHHRSKNRPHMSMTQRAAQFSPFAALSGLDETMSEASRLTSEKRIPAEDKVRYIDHTLRQAILSHRQVAITYYVPDPTKHGGSYITVRGSIYRADKQEDVVIMDDGSVILMYNISDISLV